MILQVQGDSAAVDGQDFPKELKCHVGGAHSGSGKELIAAYVTVLSGIHTYWNCVKSRKISVSINSS
jgi:hypothetical protein